MKPANDVTLDIKRVYLYTTILLAPLKPNVRQEILQRYHNVKCENCNMPVLEHEYDGKHDIVLHWTGNCAIAKKRKPMKLVQR